MNCEYIFQADNVHHSLEDVVSCDPPRKIRIRISPKNGGKRKEKKKKQTSQSNNNSIDQRENLLFIVYVMNDTVVNRF